MMFPRSALRLSALALSGGALFAQASVFRGPSTGPGDVLVFDAPGAAPALEAKLSGITLLPVDACGRATYTQFQPDQCRLISDVPGASRVRLPQNQGSLYRYRQDGPGGAVFGYFIVHPDGRASHLASFPGVGPLGTNDPIPDPVSVTSTGGGMLVATSTEAGGDLLVIDLATKAVRNVTADVAPLNLVPYGLTLLETWGVALTNRGPVRFDRDGSGVEYVHLRRPKTGSAGLGQNPFGGGVPRPPAYVAAGFVKSADETCVGVIAGESAALANVFVFGRTGQPACVNDQPAQMAGPGFLPASPVGPNLALSPNGQRAAWKVAGTISSECFTREVAPLATPPEVQITGDDNFTDTLNDAGVISFFDPNKVVVLVGEGDGAGGIENADAFQANFAGGQLILTNLTQTSGETQAPFLQKGSVDTSDGIYGIPGRNGSVFFQSGSSGQGFLKRMDAGTGVVETLRTAVDAVGFLDATGADFVFGLVHDTPGPYEILRVPFETSLPAVTLSTSSLATQVLRHATSPDGYFAAILPYSGKESLARVFVPSGLGETASTTPRFYGPTLGFDGVGAVLASVQIGTSTFVFSWDGPGGIGNYATGGGAAFALPGI